MRDPVSVYSGFDEVHQRTRAEIQQNALISSHQISSRCSGGMHIGAGAENSKAHGLNRYGYEAAFS